MLVYFSATGNTRHVMTEIALEGEPIVSMEEALAKGVFDFRVEDSRLGILTPTYFWSIPSIVKEFLVAARFHVSPNTYVFHVGTYGTTTGASSRMVEKLLAKSGIRLDASFDIRMPDTWTPIFNLSDKGKVKRINANADVEIETLKKQLSEKVKGRHLHAPMPYALGKIGEVFYGEARSTLHFNVSEACIGCGLCAARCPKKVISMKGGRPVWTRLECTMCLGCLHRCPKFAIRYGTRTLHHGQYTHP